MIHLPYSLSLYFISPSVIYIHYYSYSIPPFHTSNLHLSLQSRLIQSRYTIISRGLHAHIVPVHSCTTKGIRQPPQLSKGLLSLTNVLADKYILNLQITVQKRRGTIFKCKLFPFHITSLHMPYFLQTLIFSYCCVIFVTN